MGIVLVGLATYPNHNFAEILSKKESVFDVVSWTQSKARHDVTNSPLVDPYWGIGRNTSKEFYYQGGFNFNITPHTTWQLGYAGYFDSALRNTYALTLMQELLWDPKNKWGIKMHFGAHHLNYETGLQAEVFRVNVMATKTLDQWLFFAGLNAPLGHRLSLPGYQLVGRSVASLGYVGAEYVINRDWSVYAEYFENGFGLGISFRGKIYKYKVYDDGDTQMETGHPFYIFI